MVNAKGEVLLVQEKWIRRLSYKHWKLPGGHTEKGIPSSILCCVFSFLHKLLQFTAGYAQKHVSFNLLCELLFK